MIFMPPKGVTSLARQAYIVTESGEKRSSSKTRYDLILNTLRKLVPEWQLYDDEDFYFVPLMLDFLS
jgi:hypothetical protein